MPRHFRPFCSTAKPVTYSRLFKPLLNGLPSLTPLKSGSNRPLTFTFEHQLSSLVWFHLHDHQSGRELLQVLDQDTFAKAHIAPPEGVSRGAFFEAMNTRGVSN